VVNFQSVVFGQIDEGLEKGHIFAEKQTEHYIQNVSTKVKLFSIAN
jgi:hypothetical protein